MGGTYFLRCDAMITGEMTNRGVTYIGYKCNIIPPCAFCYYKFEPKTWKSLKEIKIDLIRQAKYYGFTHTDITGGEPTFHPDIIEILKFCHSLNIKPTLITNGLMMTEKMDDLVDDWLISIHGLEKEHNYLTKEGAFEIVTKNLKKIKKPFRLNCVITKYNYKIFPDYAKWVCSLKNKPKELNFINFNPFGKWSLENIDFMVNLNDLNSYLFVAIKMLEEKNIIVNVRYLPFCFAEGFEKNIVSFSQVWADDKEWNWAHQLNKHKNFSTDKNFGYQCGRNTVMRNAIPLNECRGCIYEMICDGMSLSYIKNTVSKPIPITGEKILNPLYFWMKEKNGK